MSGMYAEVDQPRGRRPAQRKEIVFRGQRLEPLRIHADEPSRERAGDKRPRAGQRAQSRRRRPSAAEAAARRRRSRRQARSRTTAPSSGAARPRAATSSHVVPGSRPRRKLAIGERADRERQLPRVKVPFERVGARLDDRVAQRQRRQQRDCRPLRAIEHAGDARRRPSASSASVSDLQDDEDRRQRVRRSRAPAGRCTSSTSVSLACE